MFERWWRSEPNLPSPFLPAILTLPPRLSIAQTPDSVSGNVSVEGGVIDFYVTNPTGFAMFYYNKIDKTDFNFTASENGNYAFHFVNPLSTANVSVTLNYAIKFVVTSEVSMVFNAEASATTWRVFLPPPRPRKPNLEDFCRTYLNLREAEKILNVIRAIWRDMPLQSFVGILSLAVLIQLCYGFARRRSIARY